MIKQTIGFNWGAAGLSNGVWTGVRLRDVLKLAGVTGADDYKPGMHVRFASEHEKGGDKLPGGVYGTSVTLEKALDDSQDIILAFMYNGKALTVDHGFPVRVIIPGYIGGRMIKWLTNIDLQDQESQDYYHFYDNRVLPPHVDADIAKAERWWYKPEYICNDLNVNSAMVFPAHDEMLVVSSPSDVGGAGGVPPRLYKAQGYAYTGGGKKITRVEVSLNSGAEWRLANHSTTEVPNRFGKYWCWWFWEIELPHADFLGAHEIVLRAWDEGHAVQPDKPTWNLMGMLNNPWFRIKIHKVEEETVNGKLLTSLRFEHPTLAGNQNGGWMMKLKEHPSLTSPGVYLDCGGGNSMQGNVGVAAALATKEDTKRKEEPFDPTKPHFSIEEVALHNNDASAWIVVTNKVYDATRFLKDHPGGADSILLSAGTDCTEEFEAIHSKKAWKMLDEYYIGQLRPDPSTGGRAGVSVTLESTQQENEILVAYLLAFCNMTNFVQISFRCPFVTLHSIRVFIKICFRGAFFTMFYQIVYQLVIYETFRYVFKVFIIY
jgi:nitrate reductase (NAD(P)H)